MKTVDELNSMALCDVADYCKNNDVEVVIEDGRIVKTA